MESCNHRFWKSTIFFRSKACYVYDSEKATGIQKEFSANCHRNCERKQTKYFSDIFSMDKIILVVLDLIPTVTARSIIVTKSAINKDPAKHPTLKELFAVF